MGLQSISATLCFGGLTLVTTFVINTIVEVARSPPLLPPQLPNYGTGELPSAALLSYSQESPEAYLNTHNTYRAVVVVRPMRWRPMHKTALIKGSETAGLCIQMPCIHSGHLGVIDPPWMCKSTLRQCNPSKPAFADPPIIRPVENDNQSYLRGPSDFSYKELSKATKNFVEEEKLGEGGFGSTYKGFSRDSNVDVTVKRISRRSKQGIKEYTTKELLLAYEFTPNGSLDSHLFKARGLLPWNLRFKIVDGLASALLIDKASKESDVYSFGVQTLEIACGRRSIEPSYVQDQASLIAWVWEAYGNHKLLDLVGKKLSEDFDSKEMECSQIVGLWCTHPDHSIRPSIIDQESNAGA
ncbi:hypothetical protein SLEP1_g35863 [Rubroshorea leprosula]|uniref:Protein kinase domain-containing protein n=1 Tax=Rubroshorea leprosula TaxID=152421 RepID=A0AAV5KPY2_9ROSI|nr:hypothetical protein SLEP1_g35863 [Rubroshorea leprosula]